VAGLGSQPCDDTPGFVRGFIRTLEGCQNASPPMRSDSAELNHPRAGKSIARKSGRDAVESVPTRFGFGRLALRSYGFATHDFAYFLSSHDSACSAFLPSLHFSVQNFSVSTPFRCGSAARRCNSPARSQAANSFLCVSSRLCGLIPLSSKFSRHQFSCHSSDPCSRLCVCYPIYYLPMILPSMILLVHLFFSPNKSLPTRNCLR
jgi:hypothetical protein